MCGGAPCTSPHCLFNMMGKSPSRSRALTLWTLDLGLHPWALGVKCPAPKGF